MTTFDKINIQAQVVNGKCPHCTEDSIFVSIYKTIFRYKLDTYIFTNLFKILL